MHDPVEGSAAATSAMYSPHLADIIARVVMGLPNAVGGGGEELLFHLRQLG